MRSKVRCQWHLVLKVRRTFLNLNLALWRHLAGTYAVNNRIFFCETLHAVLRSAGLHTHLQVMRGWPPCSLMVYTSFERAVACFFQDFFRTPRKKRLHLQEAERQAISLLAVKIWGLRFSFLSGQIGQSVGTVALFLKGVLYRPNVMKWRWVTQTQYTFRHNKVYSND